MNLIVFINLPSLGLSISATRGALTKCYNLQAFNKTEKRLEIKVLQLMSLLHEKNCQIVIIPHNLSSFVNDNTTWGCLKFGFLIPIMILMKLEKLE